MRLTMDAAYTLSGFAVGIIVGLTGIGAGSLLTPFLTLGMGLPAPAAVGLSVANAFASKAGGGWAHAQQGHVDWRIVRLLAAGSLPAAGVALLFLKLLSSDPAALVAFTRVCLGFALVLTALLAISGRRLIAWTATLAGRSEAGRSRLNALGTVAAGALVGALVTITSVGAGTLGAAALVLLHPGLPAARVVGTDIAHAVPLALFAAAGHVWLGHVDFTLLGSLLAGSLPGILLGARLAGHVPESILRPALALMLCVVGGRLVF